MINIKSNTRKIAAIAFIIVLLLTSIAMAFSATPAVLAEESYDRLSLMSFVQSGDIVSGIGDGGHGSWDLPYYEHDWNGRILSQTKIGSTTTAWYMLEINVDPRNSIKDDIIVEYKFYEKSHTIGTQTNIKLEYFRADVVFDSARGKVNLFVEKRGDTAAGFTRSSGINDVRGVSVVVSYTHEGMSGNIYFYFGSLIP